MEEKQEICRRMMCHIWSGEEIDWPALKQTITDALACPDYAPWRPLLQDIDVMIEYEDISTIRSLLLAYRNKLFQY